MSFFFFLHDSTNHDWLGFHQCIENIFLSSLVDSSSSWMCFRFCVCVCACVWLCWCSTCWSKWVFLTDCALAILQASQTCLHISSCLSSKSHTMMWPCAHYSCHPGTSVLTSVSPKSVLCSAWRQLWHWSTKDHLSLQPKSAKLWTFDQICRTIEIVQ